MPNKRQKNKRKKKNKARKEVAQAYDDKVLEEQTENYVEKFMKDMPKVDDSHLIFEKFLKDKSDNYDDLTMEMSVYDEQVKEFTALETDEEKKEWIQKNIKGLI